jgi:hypothetical protein
MVNGKPKEKFTDDPGGDGTQIVREVIACPACASRAVALDRNGR